MRMDGNPYQSPVSGKLAASPNTRSSMSGSAAVASRPARVASIDAYRGLVMFLMMAEVVRLAEVSRRVPGSGFWAFLGHHQSHAEWLGCSLHDLIQPSFSFLVGVALPYSIASRQARGQSTLRMSTHAFWRAFLLIALGVFLRSIGTVRKRTTRSKTR